MNIFSPYKTTILALMAAILAFPCQGMRKNSSKDGFYPQNVSDFCTIGRSFGAGVLPYYEDEKGEKYVLLGREVNSLSNEWAFFSGGCEASVTDKRSMEHPLDCAAREFYEEAALPITLGWDQAKVKEYISKNATEVIARYSRDVKSSRPLIIYVVKFSKKQIETIINTFQRVFNDSKIEDTFKEKDALAVVKYQDLIDAVKKNERCVKLDKNLPSWFNKNKEDSILIFHIPYFLLRARYAPDVPFRIRQTEYHYIHDVSLSSQGDIGKQQYQFLAQEPVNKGLRSKL